MIDEDDFFRSQPEISLLVQKFVGKEGGIFLILFYQSILLSLSFTCNYKLPNFRVDKFPDIRYLELLEWEIFNEAGARERGTGKGESRNRGRGERKRERGRRAVATSAARFNYTLQTHDMSKSYTSYRLRHLLKVSSRATVLLRPPSPLAPPSFFPRRERI